MIIIRKAEACAIVGKKNTEVKGSERDIGRILVASALALQNAGYEMNDTLAAFKQIKKANPQTNAGDPA